MTKNILKTLTYLIIAITIKSNIFAHPVNPPSQIQKSIIRPLSSNYLTHDLSDSDAETKQLLIGSWHIYKKPDVNFDELEAYGLELRLKFTNDDKAQLELGYKNTTTNVEYASGNYFIENNTLYIYFDYDTNPDLKANLTDTSLALNIAQIDKNELNLEDIIKAKKIKN